MASLQPPSDGSGGTKIQRRPRPEQQQQQQMSQQQQQQQMSQQQQYQQQHQQHQQQYQPHQQQQPHQPQQSVNKPVKRDPPPEIMVKNNFKSFFGNTSGSNFKYSVLVCVIFIILNSKIVWRQFTKLPFMGSVEPSMAALIINSILAGLVFFIISKLINLK